MAACRWSGDVCDGFGDWLCALPIRLNLFSSFVLSSSSLLIILVGQSSTDAFVTSRALDRRLTFLDGFSLLLASRCWATRIADILLDVSCQRLYPSTFSTVVSRLLEPSTKRPRGRPRDCRPQDVQSSMPSGRPLRCRTPAHNGLQIRSSWGLPRN